MQESIVHIAVHSETKTIIGVKVSAWYKTANMRYLDHFLIKFGHNKFTLISYPVLIPKRTTKAFDRFIDMKHVSDIATHAIIGTLAEELRQGHAK